VDLKGILIKFPFKDGHGDYYETIIRSTYVTAEKELESIAKIYPNYTGHDITHSNRVLDYIFDILKIMIKDPNDHSINKDTGLNDDETLILVCAALLHDISLSDTTRMSTKNIEKLTTKNRAEGRKYHGKDGKQKIIKEYFKEFADLDEIIVQQIAEVAGNHDQNLTLMGKDTKGVRLKLLSALLHLGDAMDITYKRIRYKELKNFDISKKSATHWALYHYVQNITVEKNKIIVEVRFPEEYFDDDENNVMRSYAIRISEKIKNKFLACVENEDQANDVFEVLNEYKITFAKTPVQIDKIQTNLYNRTIYHNMSPKLRKEQPPKFKLKDSQVKRRKGQSNSRSPPSQALSKTMDHLLEYISLIKRTKTDKNYCQLVDTYVTVLQLVVENPTSELFDPIVNDMLNMGICDTQLMSAIKDVLKTQYRDKIIEAANTNNKYVWQSIIHLLRNSDNFDILPILQNQEVPAEQIESILHLIEDYIWLKYNKIIPDDDGRLNLHDGELIKKMIDKCSSLSSNDTLNLRLEAINVLIMIKRCVDLNRLEIESNILKPQHIETFVTAIEKNEPYKVGSTSYFSVTSEIIKYFSEFETSDETKKLLKNSYKNAETVNRRLTYFWIGLFANIWDNEQIFEMAKDFLNNNCLVLSRQKYFRTRLFDYINLSKPDKKNSEKYLKWKDLSDKVIVVAYTARNNVYDGCYKCKKL
jgi:hypothetical protein